MQKERRLNRKREKRITEKVFIKNPFEFAKIIFLESNRGTLKCIKESLKTILKKLTVTQDK